MNTSPPNPPETSPNHVRTLREAAGITQSALAKTIGLSRQSLSNIEAGRTVPGVNIALRIAAVLNTSVEQIFYTSADQRRPELLTAEAVLPHADSLSAPQSRVTLARIHDRWLAYPLEHNAMHRAADGIIDAASTPKNTKIQPLRPLHEARENLILTGCAGALGLLADQLNTQNHRTNSTNTGRAIWIHGSSTAALQAIANHQTHIAGIHLVDPHTGESNTADVRRYTHQQPLALITLAHWQTGILVAANNPKSIHSGECLARTDLRIVTREFGAGTQRLLENLWKTAGKLPDSPNDPLPLQARGHLEVAHAIAIGAADAGIASQDAALAYNLEFIPLADERYDLVIPLASLEDARIQRLLNNLTSYNFRIELTALGYDTAPSGARVDYISAA